MTQKKRCADNKILYPNLPKFTQFFQCPLSHTFSMISYRTNLHNSAQSAQFSHNSAQPPTGCFSWKQTDSNPETQFFNFCAKMRNKLCTPKIPYSIPLNIFHLLLNILRLLWERVSAQNAQNLHNHQKAVLTKSNVPQPPKHRFHHWPTNAKNIDRTNATGLSFLIEHSDQFRSMAEQSPTNCFVWKQKASNPETLFSQLFIKSKNNWSGPKIPYPNRANTASNHKNPDQTKT